MSSRDRRVLVVVPAHNESGSIADVVNRIRAVDLPCVVVDDGSADGTASIARAAGAQAVSLPINLGVGGALRAGFRYALEHGYDAVVQCDGDGQHPPERIRELIAAGADADADLVIGSRFVEGAESFDIGRARRLAMRWLSWLLEVRSGVTVADTTSGFRYIAQPLLGEFAREFPTHYLGDTFEALLVAGRGGYRIAEVPTRIDARPVGSSTANTAAALKYVLRSTVVAGLGLTFRVRPRAVAAAEAPAPEG